MKEITRIHIAKTPYNIEIDAKKLLEKYLNDLSALGNDADVLEDIELRIVELLGERSVKPDGTITQADVMAVKKQLGEPEEIADEPVSETAGTEPGRKKLFRYPQRGVIGGVASGLAEIFGVSVAWIRVAMIILAFISFGTAFVAYIVAWLVIPPVRSAKDLLQLRGKPVTPSAISRLNETEGSFASNRDKIAVRFLTILLGLVATGGMITALLATIIGGIHTSREIGFNDAWEVLFIVLAIASGLLLTVFCGIIAYAAFAQKATRRIVTAVVAVALAGMLTFGTLVGTGYYYAADTRSRLQQSMKTDTLTLPDGFQSVNYLEVNMPSTEVVYEVSNEPKITYEYSTLDKSAQKPDVKAENGRLIISGDEITPDKKDALRFFATRTLTIAGPDLKTAQVLHDTHITYFSSQQTDFKVLIGRNASLTLNKSVIKNLEAYVQQEGLLDTELSNVSNLSLDVQNGAEFVGGNLASLKVRADESCSINQRAEISIRSLNNPTWTLNNTEKVTDDFREACLRLAIDSDEYENE